MPGMTREPIERLGSEAADLDAHHPPRWTHPHKRLVHDLSLPPGSIHAGRIGHSRRAAFPRPAEVDPAAEMAGIEHLVMHAASPEGVGAVDVAVIHWRWSRQVPSTSTA